MNKTRKIAIVLVALMFAIGISFLSTTVYAKCDPTTSDSDNSCYTYDESTNTYTLNSNLELTASWTITENTTINLNGYTIQTTQSYKGDTIIVEESATLTITGDGTITNTYNKDNYAALWNNGTVIINGATFELDTSSGNTYYVIVNQGTMTINDATVKSNDSKSSVIINGEYQESGTNRFDKSTIDEGTAKLTINGGTFSGGKYTIKNGAVGELEINDGTFENSTQATIMNWNEAIINGGTFKNTAESDSITILLGVSSDEKRDTAGSLTIDGGTFTADYILANKDDSAGQTTVNVSNGIFNYSNSLCKETENIAISATGGTYSGVDVIPEYDEDTYMLLDNEDGTYTVVLKSSYDESVYNITTNDDGSVTVTEKDADYSAVEEVIAKADALNESDYTEESWADLQQAIANVGYGLKISDQDTVDFYAEAIQDAIDNLVPVDDEEQTAEPQDSDEDQAEDTQTEDDSLNPTTGDMIILFGSILLVSVAGLIVTIKIRKRANK